VDIRPEIAAIATRPCIFDIRDNAVVHLQDSRHWKA
jgi:hypothetical protein